MIAPAPRAVVLFAAGVPLAAAVTLVRAELWVVWVVYVGAALALVAADALLLLPKKQLRVVWRRPAQVPLGDTGLLRVELSAGDYGRAAVVRVRFEVGELVQPVADADVALKPRETATVDVPLRPKRRGVVHVESCALRWRGPLGLVVRTERRAVDERIAVVPNLDAARAEAIRFFQQRDLAAGLKAQHFVGEGSEFDALREFVPGFDSRAIDWKSSAKHHRLLVREFRAERNHQIVVAIDTGRLMCEPIAGMPRIDHAIQAGLLLSYIGLKAGDRVGWFAFDAKVRLHIQPAQGLRSLQVVRTQTAELAYSTDETNFTLGFVELLGRLKRRTLVVLFTDFVDTVAAELMLRTLEEVARRHLLCFVSLRDPLMAELMDASPRSETLLHRAVIARDFLRERDVVFAKLARLGVSCIDANAHDAPTRLVQRYLEIRRRELI